MYRNLTAVLSKKEIITDKVSIRTFGIVFFALLTVLGAFVYIPLPYTPVPITMQTFFVLLCGAFLRRKDAVLTQGSYLLMGACGLPVFSAAGAGMLKLFGPTGGYIVGFVLSVFVTGTLLNVFEKGRGVSFFRTLPAMACGLVTIYACGVLWLSFFLHCSLFQAIALGVLPFTAGAVLKLAAAAMVYTAAGARAQKIFK